MYNEEESILSSYLYKIIYINDVVNDTFYNNSRLEHRIDILNTNYTISIFLVINKESYKIGLLHIRLLSPNSIKGTFNIALENIVDSFNNLKKPNQQKIINSLEHYIINYS